MPSFKYSAVGADGRTIRGSLDARSEQECVEELRRRNLVPLQVDSRRGGGRSRPPARKAPPKRKAPNGKKRDTPDRRLLHLPHGRRTRGMQQGADGRGGDS